MEIEFGFVLFSLRLHHNDVIPGMIHEEPASKTVPQTCIWVWGSLEGTRTGASLCETQGPGGKPSYRRERTTSVWPQLAKSDTTQLGTDQGVQQTQHISVEV